MRNLDGAQQTLTEVEAAGGQGEVYQLDVRDQAAAEAAIEDIAKRLGTIDILVNNAGTLADGLFMMMPPENWHGVIETSLHGFYNMTRPVLEHMVRARRGSIVSISSAASLMPNRGQANYAAAKAGLNAASKTVASEVARMGIRVNVVAPGLIENRNDRQGSQRTHQRLDSHGAHWATRRSGPRWLLFLCSDAASYVTGQVISVNGGML